MLGKTVQPMEDQEATNVGPGYLPGPAITKPFSEIIQDHLLFGGFATIRLFR